MLVGKIVSERMVDEVNTVCVNEHLRNIIFDEIKSTTKNSKRPYNSIISYIASNPEYIGEDELPVSLLIDDYAASACNLIKKESLAQMLSCEFCSVLKSTFFIEYLRRLFLFL